MKKPIHHVKKRTLLAVAGCVWLIAGYNVARLGVLAYTGLGSALALAGLMFWLMFALYHRKKEKA